MMKLDRIIAVRTSKTVYRDGEDCIKVFDEDYSKGDVLNEALNQARVEETGLNIPKIKAVTTIDGKWAIVSARPTYGRKSRQKARISRNVRRFADRNSKAHLPASSQAQRQDER